MSHLQIQFVDILGQYHELKAELDEAIARAVRQGDYILGHETREFEAEFASYHQVSHCVGLANGTDAIHLALTALGVGQGDEVIIPANTFIATALAVSSIGARPVLVDCEEKFLQIDHRAVEKAITSRTKAIIPVHLYGHPADMDALLQIAKARSLFVIEDAAQAHGATYRGRLCGTMGDIGCFSFYPTKNLGACGDGGAILTRHSVLAERIAILRNYGQTRKYTHTVRGFNSRLDNLQAAILRVKLKRLNVWNDKRRAAAASYAEHLQSTSLSLPRSAPNTNPVWHLYAVRIADRSRLQAAFDANGIGYGIHYPIPIHLQEAYRDLGFSPGSFPVAELVAAEVMSLPMYPTLSAENIATIVKICKECCC